jgi:hypothetical protein
MKTLLPFRILGARPLGGLPPKMFVDCELVGHPPILFAIHMNGTSLDDPYAGWSPKWLLFEDRGMAARFVARFAETFKAPLPATQPGDRAPLRLEFNTVLIDRTDGWAEDRWTTGDGAELECRYSLNERAGAFWIRNIESRDPLVKALASTLVG